MHKIEKDPLRVRRPLFQSKPGVSRAVLWFAAAATVVWGVVICVFVRGCTK